jgi:glycosyltransferase involved in cell wall biosynthesis
MVPMRILILGPFEPKEIFSDLPVTALPKGFGGVPVNLLVSQLAIKGHEVTVVGTSRYIDETWEFRKGNISAFLVPSRKRAWDLALSQFSKEVELLVNLSRKLQFDVVHAHWTYEFAIAALKIDKDAIITAHDAPFTILWWFKDIYRFFRLVMSMRVRFLAKNLTCVSPYLQDKWRLEMFWRKKITIIPNICPFPPIDAPLFRFDGARIITIGDSTKRKNIKSLILGMSEIRKVLPGASLDIYGDGLDGNSTLASWAKNNSLDAGIKWQGLASRNEIQSALDKSDLLIHPSLEESQGMILLEAMSRGVPVIAGIYSGGVSWTIEDAGTLVDVRDPSAIARQAIHILKDRKRMQQMGVRGLELVKNKYSPEYVISSYVDLYNEISVKKI